LRFSSFYDLAPTADYLAKVIDFGRLNSGEVRLTIAAVDLATGDVVLFDGPQGDRIDMDHLLASCGFLPELPRWRSAVGQGGATGGAVWAKSSMGQTTRRRPIAG
jgi:hypothetical protein